MLSYPQTAMGPDGDDYHGERVPDPYRWLESTGAPETAAWIAEQNELTHGWLADGTDREAIAARLAKLADYPKYSVPFERGGRWFQFRNAGLQDQPALYVADSPSEQGRVLLDPNALAADGTVTVSGIALTRDGSLLAYATSAKGSDWQTWRVLDTATGEELPDVVDWAKSDNAAWLSDRSGFYYMAPEPPVPGTEYLAESGVRRILLHKIGTPQSDDEVVFATPEHPEWYPSAKVSDDGHFLIISVSAGTAPQARIFVQDLELPGSQLRPLIGDFDNIAEVVFAQNGTFYLVTDYQAERKRLVAIELDRPEREHWTEIVGEQPDTLLACYRFGGKFVSHYLRDASSQLRVYDAEGGHAHDIEVPRHYSVADANGKSEGIEGREGSELMQFGLTSFAETGSLWSHDLNTGKTELIRPSAGLIDPARYPVEQVKVTSADGTELTMWITRRDDIEPTGDVPALLYGYGGFDIPMTPAFDLLHAAWLDSGGLLAVANLRGGGEYGRAWHDGGRLAVKQNVFDDFCASARWLASSGWSRPDRIAITGASNGGLLVGACMTQHPELFGACVPAVGVMDMLRFHKFTVGRAWISDFGSPDDPEQYRWIRAYSPLHNIRAGENYPPTLVLTGDHDDRVVPGHSFKFAAAMQAAQGGDAPVLIRIETSAGHGAGKPTSKILAEDADVLAFLRRALRLTAPASAPAPAG